MNYKREKIQITHCNSDDGISTIGVFVKNINLSSAEIACGEEFLRNSLLILLIISKKLQIFIR